MPIFRVKSVKIYTGQKNLHWRRQPRQRQLSGMIMYVRICTYMIQLVSLLFQRMKIFCMVQISHRPTFGGIVKVKGAVSLAGDAEGWLWPVGFPEAGGSAVNLCSLQFVVSFGLGKYICSSSWAKLCACFVHCTLCTLSSTMTLYLLWRCIWYSKKKGLIQGHLKKCIFRALEQAGTNICSIAGHFSNLR